MRPTKYPTFVPAVDCNGPIGGGWIDYGNALCAGAPQAHIEAGWNGLNTGVVVPGGPQHRKEREPRMRKTNHAPWLGRTVGTAIMVLVGLGLFAGSASAQGMTVYDFDDAAGWWAYFDCAAMRVILGSGGDGTNAIVNASESSACKPTLDGLSRANQRIVEDFIAPAVATTNADDNVSPARFSTTEDWWDMVGDETEGCEARQRLAGVLPIASTDDSDDADSQLYCRDYDDLRPAEMEVVNGVGMAISGRMGMMTDDDEEEAPALPLVGIGILGLLLAGRGAWLRRRS